MPCPYNFCTCDSLLIGRGFGRHGYCVSTSRSSFAIQQLMRVRRAEERKEERMRC